MSVMKDLYNTKIAECIRAIYAAKYAKNDNIPCQIEEGLFLGSLGVSQNKQALEASGITHILILAKSLEPIYPTVFTYKKFEVLDAPSEDLIRYFEECFEFIDQAKKAGGGALVHCFAGRSRSATIVIAYIMKKHHLSLSEAMSLVRSKRPQIEPNMGFVAQLKKFERIIQEGFTTQKLSN